MSLNIKLKEYNFDEIFTPQRIRNTEKLEQYTIGKNGISLLTDTRHDISKHIVFYPDNLIIGIGIEEICISINTTGCCSPIYEIFKLNNNIIDSLFAKYFIPIFLYSKKNLICKKSTRREFEICNKDLLLLKIPLPPLEEQKKIGAFLKLLDELIALYEKKLELVKTYNKGLSQKLLSQQLRFKKSDGSSYPEWEEKLISQLFSISAGGDINKEKCTSEITDSNIYPIYANAIAKNGLYGYTDTFRIEGETITVTGRGDIGIAKARKEKYYPIVRLLVLKPKEKLNILFFEAVINRTKFYKEYTGVPQLTAPQVGKIKVKFPCLEEQEKIADVLSAADENVRSIEEKIQSLKNLKQGLLQKIFG